MKFQSADTVFIGFTSTDGGVGTSSAAAVFSRISAKLGNLRTLVIGFDGLSHKMSPVKSGGEYVKNTFLDIRQGKRADEVLEDAVVKDEFGVAFLTDAGFFNPLPMLDSDDLYFCMDQIAGSKLYDIVILDFPFRSIEAVKISSMCEYLVFCSDYRKNGRASAELFRKAFEGFSSDMPAKPGLIIFSPEEDRESFSSWGADLHGQFGAEVRELASELLDI